MSRGRYFRYILTADNGGAPHVSARLLTLAICKPMIRMTARRGETILGFGGSGLSKSTGLPVHLKLIYIAEVTGVLRAGEYYRDRRYSHRGDSIYRFERGRLLARADRRYHQEPGDLLR